VRLGLDEHSHLDSPLHRWEPRHKLVGLVLLIFAFSFVRQVQLLPAMLGVAFVLFITSRLPLSYLLARTRAPSLFILVTAALVPFLSGRTVLWRLGFVALRREGCLASLLIVTKFGAILTTGLVLFATGPFLTTIKAMRSLGLPAILTDMTLLAYRYIYEIGDDLLTMETAMKLRGFAARRPSFHAIGFLASLAGSILVRSYERSDRIYSAMILRGYGYGPRWTDEFPASPGDAIRLGAICLVAAGFVAAELFLRGYGG
jgi:cobalt/nickel transport system permease protein